MVGKFRHTGMIVGAGILCAIGLAQVPVIPDTPATPRPVPGTLAKEKVVPGTLAKDKQAPEPEADVSAAGEPIHIRVQNVMAPVTVFDQNGNIMDRLQPSQFHLLDNGREQDIHVTSEALPISLVICLEASYRDDAILKQIHKIGSLIEPLITGDTGEAAVIAFDHNVRTVQDFTSDSQKLKDSIAKITSGSSSARMVDAVDSAILMLRHRPANRRRIILLVSETRDKGSFARGRETLIALQLSNITLYAVDISQFARRLTEEPQPARPDPIAPEARNLPMGANTPLAVDQTTGRNNSADFVPALKEIYTDAKAIFIRNPIQVFTKGTGGTQLSFLRQRGLEDAVEKIGFEIHTQYILTYSPKPETLLEGGYHQLEIQIDYPRARARTRPGYWLAAVN
jgi:VWFA-related protein